MKCLPRGIRARRRPVLSLASRDGFRRESRWSGCGRILPKLKPARCRRAGFVARPRSAASRHRARRRCRGGAAHHGGCARLRCAGCGGAGDVWGEARQLDLVASRKLTLAAQSSGVTALLLRVAAQPAPSTAETRWIVRAAHSPPSAPWSAWGAPVFDAQPHSQPSWPGRPLDHGMEM